MITILLSLHCEGVQFARSIVDAFYLGDSLWGIVVLVKGIYKEIHALTAIVIESVFQELDAASYLREVKV